MVGVGVVSCQGFERLWGLGKSVVPPDGLPVRAVVQIPYPVVLLSSFFSMSPSSSLSLRRPSLSFHPFAFYPPPLSLTSNPVVPSAPPSPMVPFLRREVVAAQRINMVALRTRSQRSVLAPTTNTKSLSSTLHYPALPSTPTTMTPAVEE